VWIAELVFDHIIVPVYRWYALAIRKLELSAPESFGRLSNFFSSRLTLHALVVVTALILVSVNVSSTKGLISSDEVVAQTKLAELVGQGNTDSDQQLIEDYPNLDLARLPQRTLLHQHSLNVPLSILTKGQIEAPEEPSLARTTPIAYTVQNKDTISSIAHRFHVSINTILWENNLKATSLIRVGDQLTILPSSGVSHTVTRGQTISQIAKLYGVSPDEILKANNLTNPNQLTVGAKLVIPGGSRLANAQTPAQTAARRISAGLKQILPGRSSSIIPSGNRMVWPTVGYNITQYFSWRHTGVDIANHIGTPIYAADDGVVTTAGWNRGGYGNMILINHGGGKQTRYGHLSAFAVRVGQRVSKGQYIAAMGSTGRSTGPHLHFEVLINGHVYNPLNYIR